MSTDCGGDLNKIGLNCYSLVWGFRCPPLNEIEYHFKYVVPDVNNNFIPNYTNKLLIIPLKFNDMNTLSK